MGAHMVFDPDIVVTGRDAAPFFRLAPTHSLGLDLVIATEFPS